MGQRKNRDWDLVSNSECARERTIHNSSASVLLQDELLACKNRSSFAPVRRSTSLPADTCMRVPRDGLRFLVGAKEAHIEGVDVLLRRTCRLCRSARFDHALLFWSAAAFPRCMFQRHGMRIEPPQCIICKHLLWRTYGCAVAKQRECGNRRPLLFLRWNRTPVKEDNPLLDITHPVHTRQTGDIWKRKTNNKTKVPPVASHFSGNSGVRIWQ